MYTSLCAFTGINETNSLPSGSHAGPPEASLVSRFEPVLSSSLTGGTSVNTLMCGHVEPPGSPQQHRVDSLASALAFATAIFTNRVHGGSLKASDETGCQRAQEAPTSTISTGKTRLRSDTHTDTHTLADMEMGKLV